MSFSYLLLDYEGGTPPIFAYRSIGQMVNGILLRRRLGPHLVKLKCLEMVDQLGILSGKRLKKTMERSAMLFMGNFTISMVIFHSYVSLPKAISHFSSFFHILGIIIPFD